MANITRIRINWAGPAIVGPAVSTVYSDDAVDGHSTVKNALNVLFNALDNLCSSAVTWVMPATMDVIDDATGNLVDVVTGDQISGAFANAAEQVARATMLNLRFNTAGIVNNHRVKGRIYVPGLSIGALDDGQLSSANLASINSAAATFASATAGHFRVWSRPFEPAPGQEDPPPSRSGSSHLLTTAVFQQKLAVLRSRRD